MNFIEIINMQFMKNFFFIGSGISLSFGLLLGSIIFGFVFGIIFSVARYNKIFSNLINGFISIVRGTPVILQISVIYFAIPGLLHVQLSIFSAGILAFGINSSVYMAEIFRSGIESVPKGQFEAAKTLNIPIFYTWKDIIFPQVIRNILPALTNEVITLFKETALISTIGGMDIMRKAQIISASDFSYFTPLCIAAFYYYIFILFVEKISKRIERKMIC
jgi:polar amino acid transport system permease protein